MLDIEQLPQFTAPALLRSASAALESADVGGAHGGIVEHARTVVSQVLAAHLGAGPQPNDDPEQRLRSTARALLTLSDPGAQRAGLAIIAAADMMRTA